MEELLKFCRKHGLEFEYDNELEALRFKKVGSQKPVMVYRLYRTTDIVTIIGMKEHDHFKQLKRLLLEVFNIEQDKSNDQQSS